MNGHSGADISQLAAQYSGEHVVFKPGTGFAVERYWTDDLGWTHIELRELFDA